MNFNEKVKQNKMDMISDLRQLLRIPSVLIETPDNPEAPFGQGLRDALDFILALGEKMGFKTKRVDQIAGHIEFGEGEEIIGILCHLDVVPAGEGWKYDPFQAVIEDNKIYARGAIDDKGPLISALYAMKIIKDLKLPIHKRIRLIVGTDEETAWRGIKRYLEVSEMPTFGFSPDANFPLIYGEKGILSLDLISNFQDQHMQLLEAGERYNVVPEKAVIQISNHIEKDFQEYLKVNQLVGDAKLNEYTIHGQSAHAMEPNNGINALIHMAHFVTGFHHHPLLQFISEKLSDSRFKKMGLHFTDPEMGDLTVNVALARIDQQGGRIGLNLRYPINWSKDEFLSLFAKEALKYGIEVREKEDSKPHFVDKNSWLVQVLHQAYIKYTGDTTTPPATIGGGTYARALKNAVAFGMMMPGREDVVHEKNEYVFIEDILTATAIYCEAIAALGK